VRVAHAIRDLGPGGAQQVLVDLARVAPDAGIEMSVLSLVPTAGFAAADALQRSGVQVVSLGLRSPWDPRGAGRMRMALRSLGPDVVHSHLDHADVMTALAMRRSSVPQVSTLHFVEDRVAGLAGLERRLAARVRNARSDRIVAVSDAVRRRYVEWYGGDADQVVTIRNGVADPAPLGPHDREDVRRHLGVTGHTTLAVMVPVMRPAEGHEVLLDAAALITPEVDVTFVLDGDRDLHDDLRTRAAALPPGRVSMPRFVDDVDRLLAAADLVVHPSGSDSLPTALIQALAASVPSVVANVGGVPEVVGPDAGVLVPPGDPGALADAIIAMVRDPDSRQWMGKRARERFDERFEPMTWVRRLERLYRSLI
jgi:glycosyltransferase involved in cell wall biosynthesis